MCIDILPTFALSKMTKGSLTYWLHNYQNAYAGLGYIKTRSHFRYNQKGELTETRFPVWTKKGLELFSE